MVHWLNSGSRKLHQLLSQLRWFQSEINQTTWVHQVLAGSHIFFVRVFWKLLSSWNGIFGTVIPLFLFVNVVLWSTLMHLSETKKGLFPGQWLSQHSRLFLDLDRFFAVITATYVSILFIILNVPDFPLYFCQFITVALVSVVGEILGSSYNYIPYVVCHLFWHFAVAELAFYSFNLFSFYPMI